MASWLTSRLSLEPIILELHSCKRTTLTTGAFYPLTDIIIRKFPWAHFADALNIKPHAGREGSMKRFHTCKHVNKWMALLYLFNRVICRWFSVESIIDSACACVPLLCNSSKPKLQLNWVDRFFTLKAAAYKSTVCAWHEIPRKKIGIHRMDALFCYRTLWNAVMRRAKTLRFFLILYCAFSHPFPRWTIWQLRESLCRGHIQDGRWRKQSQAERDMALFSMKRLLER